MKFLASSAQINVSHEFRADKSPAARAQYGQDEGKSETEMAEMAEKKERVCADNSQQKGGGKNFVWSTKKKSAET